MTDPRNRLPDEGDVERPDNKMKVTARDVKVDYVEVLKGFVAHAMGVHQESPVQKTVLMSWLLRETGVPDAHVHLNGTSDGDFMAALTSMVDLFARGRGYSPVMLAERLVTAIRRLRK